MTVLWQTGDTWPGDVHDRIGDVGIVVITHRGTSHYLRRPGGSGGLLWTRGSRGGSQWSPFPPTAIGTITPCGLTLIGPGIDDWHATSRVIYIATANDTPNDNTLNTLIELGTPPLPDHPDEPCDAVYCDRITDTPDALQAHLVGILESIDGSTWTTE